ncbi:MAG: hypothetical protein ACI8TP_001466 [Acidimicrobiales bacterium]|jgi:hypothetical protein
MGDKRKRWGPSTDKSAAASEIGAPEVRSEDEKKGGLRRRLILGVIALVLLVLAYWIGGAVIPRWWAQRLGNVIDGGLLAGTVLGLAIGAIFTFLPIAALRIGWRLRGGWKRTLWFLLGATVLAGPNLATLGIVLGNGNAAHAGERILDVEGPGFRGGSLVGAVLAALVSFGVIALLRSRRKNKTKAGELQAELKIREGLDS